MELEGKIFSGMGVGKEYLSLEPYQRKIKDVTGFRPFPGTLNIRCKQQEVEDVLDRYQPSRISSFTFQDEKYSGLDIYEATLQGKQVAVLRMDVTDYTPEVVEIIAEDNLRKEVGLEDGDEVSLRF